MRRPIVVVALTLAATATLEAQQLSLTPQLGFYIPTEKLVELAGGGGTGELEAGPSLGLRLGLWFGSRIGLEATGSYVPTTFRLAQGSQQLQSEQARLFVATGQFVVFLVPRTSPLSVWLDAGVGVVSRGGVAFSGESDRTDIAGTAGAGIAISLGGMAVSAAADVLGYTASYTGSSQTEAKLEQRDIHLKVGLGIPVGGGSVAQRRRAHR